MVDQDEMDRALNVLGMNTILPVQYFEKSGLSISGEHKLMIAILEDAVRCYHPTAPQRKKRKFPRIVQETKAWFNSTRRNRLHSFQNICDVLGLDAQQIRNQLRGAQERSTKLAVESVRQKTVG